MNSSIIECSIEPINLKKDKLLYTIFNLLKYAFIVVDVFLGLLALFIAKSFIIFTLISVVFTLVFLKLQHSFYVFYDYSIISNEIRFSKVINNKSRRFIFSAEIQNLEKISYFDKNIIKNLSKQQKIKIIYAIPKNYNSEKLYFIVNKNGQKFALITANNVAFTKLILKKANTKIIDNKLYNSIF